MKFAVEVQHRDYSVAINFPGLTLQPIRYSWAADFGPEFCEVEASGDVWSLWELTYFLRAPLLIRDPHGEYVWWGWIEEIELPGPGARGFGVTLKDMANKVAVTYSLSRPGLTTSSERETTTWVVDYDSVNTYGTKELLASATAANVAMAEKQRDTLFNEKHYPVVSRTSQSDEKKAIIRARGWGSTFNWMYYSHEAAYEANQPDDEDELKEQYLDYATVGVGQSFSLAVSGEYYRLGMVQLRLYKLGTPPSLKVDVCLDNSGKPGTVLDTATITQDYVKGSADKLNVDMAGIADLSYGSTYWIKVTANGMTNLIANPGFESGFTSWTQNVGDGIIEQDGTVYHSGSYSCKLFSRDAADTYVYQELALSAGSWLLDFWTRGNDNSHGDADGRYAIYNVTTGEYYVENAGTGQETPTWGHIHKEFTLKDAATIRFMFYGPSENNCFAHFDDIYVYNGCYVFSMDELCGYSRGSVKVTADGTNWAARSPDADLWFLVGGEYETTRQIQLVVEQCGQFFQGIDTIVASGVYSSPYRDGDATALDVLMNLFSPGDGAGKRLLSRVTKERYLQFFSKPDYSDSAVRIFEDENGDFIDFSGLSIAHTCPAGQWVRLKGWPPPTVDVLHLATCDHYFIERCEYNVEEGTLTVETGESPYGVGEIQEG